MTKNPQKILDKNLLGIWKFDKSAIEDMKNLTKVTKHSGIEQGSSLCGNLETKKIKLQGQCIGTVCKLKRTFDNCGDLIDLGFFHTHPKTKEPYLSASDLFVYDLFNDQLSCLGLPEVTDKKNIICHINKSNNKTYQNERIKEIENLRKYRDIEKEVSKLKYEQTSSIKPKNFLEKEKMAREYAKFYQKKFLTKFNPEDYVNKE